VVSIAGNGKEALEKVKARTYDAVLMDIQMPVMEGSRRPGDPDGWPIQESADHCDDGSCHGRDREKSLEAGMNDHEHDSTRPRPWGILTSSRGTDDDLDENRQTLTTWQPRQERKRLNRRHTGNRSGGVRAVREGRLSATDWIQAGQELLRERGISAIKLAALTERLGVSTGSFYHHFADFEQYLGALADQLQCRARAA